MVHSVAISQSDSVLRDYNHTAVGCHLNVVVHAKLIEGLALVLAGQSSFLLIFGGLVQAMMMTTIGCKLDLLFGHREDTVIKA